MKRVNLNLPMILVQIYLSFTVIIFIIGPWDYKLNNTLELYLNLFLYQILLYIGFSFGRRYIRVKKNSSLNNEETNIKILKYLILIILVVLVLEVIRSTGLTSLSIRGIIDKTVEGIKSPSSGYYSKLAINSSNIFLGGIGSLIITLASPIMYLVIISTIIYYKKLNKIYKILGAINIGLYLIKYIATGTNKGIFDVILIISAILFLNHSIQENKVNSQKKNKKEKLKIYSRILVLGIVALCTFNYFIGSRSFGVNLSKYTQIGDTISLKNEANLTTILPDVLDKPVILLSSYLGQGYYGLSLSMQVQQKPMFGFGNSLFIVDQFNINDHTIQKAVEQEFAWDSRVQWSSLYSWIANDFGFFGVYIYMFMLGVFFAVIYKDIVKNNNIIAKNMFVLLIIQFFFIPANNQMGVNMNSLFGSTFIFILWIISKKICFKLR